MFETPEEILRLLEKIARDNPQMPASDQIALAVKQATKLKRWPEYEPDLARQMLGDLMYEVRSGINKVLMAPVKGKHSTAKVKVGESKAVSRLSDYYLYDMDGRALGDIYGRELADISKKQREIANGSLFRSELTKTLDGLVPDNKKVRTSVPHDKLRDIFDKTWDKVEGSQFC